MKKFISCFLIMILLELGIKANAEMGIVNKSDNEAMDCDSYKGGHGDYLLIEPDFEQIGKEDFGYMGEFRFESDYFCEYLIIPYKQTTVNFYNGVNEDFICNITNSGETVNGLSFRFLNKTISFPADDNDSNLLTIKNLDKWKKFLNCDDYIKYDDGEYELENAFVGQSQNTNVVSFNMYSKDPQVSFLVCRLYTNSMINNVYIDKDPYLIVPYEPYCSIDDLLSNVKVTNKENINVKLVETNYPTSELKPGNYYFICMASDICGNVSKQKIYVKAVDNKAPVISGRSEYTYYYNKIVTDLVSVAKANLTAVDEIDGTLTDFYVIEDNYTQNRNKVGEYIVTYGIKDKAGNEATYDVKFIVKDNDKPLITPKCAPSQALGDNCLTKNEILAMFDIRDDCDKDNIKIELDGYDNYASNYQKIGRYDMKIIATDQSNNKSELSFFLAVVDKKNPDIVISDDAKKIIVPSGEALDEEEIKKLIFNSTNKNVKSVISSYFDTDKPSGEYDLIVTFEDGSIETLKLSVESNKNNYYPYIIIAGGVLILASGFIFYSYKKKKKTKDAQ